MGRSCQEKGMGRGMMGVGEGERVRGEEEKEGRKKLRKATMERKGRAKGRR